MVWTDGRTGTSRSMGRERDFQMHMHRHCMKTEAGGFGSRPGVDSCTWSEASSFPYPPFDQDPSSASLAMKPAASGSATSGTSTTWTAGPLWRRSRGQNWVARTSRGSYCPIRCEVVYGLVFV